MNTKLVRNVFGAILIVLSAFARPAAALAAPPVQAAAAPSLPPLARPAASPDQALAAMTPPTMTLVISNTFSWGEIWGGSGAHVGASSTALDKLGNLFIAGQFDGQVNFDPARINANSTFTSSHGTVDAYLTKFNASGQYQWTRVWGSGWLTDTDCMRPEGCGRDAASDVAVDDLGNAYVAGLFQDSVDMGAGLIITSNAPTQKNNIFVAKFAADGATQWARAFGGTTGGEAYSVAVDAARNALYVEGDWSTSPNTGTVDFNPGGANGVRQNHGFYDAFLSKYDLSGDFQWVRTWGGSQYDDGPGVAVDPASGDLYVCGMYGSQDINFDPNNPSNPAGWRPASDNSSMLLDVFLTKFDANGNWKWVRTWGGPGVEDAGVNAVVDHAGNVYAVGRFKCTNCNFNVGANGPANPPDLHSTAGSFDGFLSKFTADGTFLWARTWAGAKADQAGALEVDDANNIYVGGVIDGIINPTTFAWTEADASLRKFSADGTLQWATSWGGSQADWLSGLALDAARNIYTAGSVQGSVDFNPGSGVCQPAALGAQDAYLSLFAAQTVVLTATAWLPYTAR